MLQNALHVAQTWALGGSAQKVTKVRISLSPPPSLSRREIGLRHGKNPWKSRQFHRFCNQTGPEKVHRRSPRASFLAIFSVGHIHSPVSATAIGRMQCDREVSEQYLREYEIITQGERNKQHVNGQHWWSRIHLVSPSSGAWASRNHRRKDPKIPIMKT